MNRSRTTAWALRALACTALVLVGLAPAASGVPAAAAPRTSATSLVLDRAGIFDDTALVKQLNRIDTDGTYRIGVLSTDDPSLHADTYDKDVYRYLTSQEDSALVDADGTIADDVLVLTVSPKIRKIGAYGGSDLDLDADQVATITSAMRPKARSGDWNGSVYAGARAYADDVSGTQYDPDEDGLPDNYPGYGADTVPSTSDDSDVGKAFAMIGIIIAAGAGVVGAGVGIAKLVGSRLERRRLLAWEGPGAAEVTRATSIWRQLSADARTAGVEKVSGVVVPDVSGALQVAFANDGLPTRGQRLDERSVQALLTGVDPHKTRRVRAELDYLNRTGDWEARWNTKVAEAQQQLSDADGSVRAMRREVGKEQARTWSAEINRTGARVVDISASVQEGRLDPVSGEKAIDKAMSGLGTYLSGQGRSFVSGLDRRRRDRLRDSWGPAQRGNGFDLQSLILLQMLASSSSHGHGYGADPEPTRSSGWDGSGASSSFSTFDSGSSSSSYDSGSSSSSFDSGGSSSF